jgi:hypothetical protein
MKTSFMCEIEAIVESEGRDIEKLYSGEHFYLEIENAPYMPLVIESFDTEYGRRISVAHYFRQNGDSVPDPEVVVTKDGYPEALYQQWGTTQVLTYVDGKTMTYSRKAKDVKEFLAMWGRNINSQGFRDAAKRQSAVSIA